jgi:hypothetical protein
MARTWGRELTHSGVGLSDTTSNTSQHTRRSWADTKALDGILFNFGRSKDQDSSFRGCLDPCLAVSLGPCKCTSKLTQGIRPW